MTFRARLKPPELSRGKVRALLNRTGVNDDITAFADLLRINRQTIYEWRSGRTPISGPALLLLLALHAKLLTRGELEDLWAEFSRREN